jgi:hypothetical protein
LHPQRDAIKARPFQPGYTLSIHTVRVALHGDLRGFAHGKGSPKGSQQLTQASLTVIGGRSTTKIDGVHLIVLQQGAGGLDMEKERLLIAIHPFLLTCQRVEVTVITFAAAKGNVNIDTQNLAHDSTPSIDLILLYPFLIVLQLSDSINPTAIYENSSRKGAFYDDATKT